MAFSLSHTIASSANKNTACTYMFDTFLPTVGWNTSAHPSASSTKRSFNRSFTNAYTGNTVTNYFWVDWSPFGANINVSEDATYTSTPGDLGTDTTNTLSYGMDDAAYSGDDYKFWTNSAGSGASMVTRGKYILWLDLVGLGDIFAFEDTGWNGSVDNNATHWWPWNHNYSGLINTNAPQQAGTSGNEYMLSSSLQGQSYASSPNDCVFKGFDMVYTSGTTSPSQDNRGLAAHFSGDEVVLHYPGSGSSNNNSLNSPSVLVQYGSNYYLRLAGNMNNVSPMVNMGTSEPTF